MEDPYASIATKVRTSSQETLSAYVKHVNTPIMMYHVLACCAQDVFVSSLSPHHIVATGREKVLAVSGEAYRSNRLEQPGIL